MAELENVFSWSVSRDRMFQSCPRMYYFHYYGAWGGWDVEAGTHRRLLYMLKKLQSRYMWAGQKVHEAIERTLKQIKNGDPVREEEVIERIIAEMRKEFLSSKKMKYRKNPKTVALFEHEYNQPVSDAEWKANAEHVIQCLEQFYKSSIYRNINNLEDEDWLEIEHLSYFVYHGIKIYVMLDFAFREGNKIRIYDWKTGKEEQNRLNLQLACYGLYAEQKWYAKPENIRLTEFYLPGNRERTWYLADLDLDKAQKYIRDSIAAMLDLLDDSRANRASEKRFALTDDEGRCRFCNFNKVCPRFRDP